MSSTSRLVYFILVITLALSAAISVYLPQMAPMPAGLPPLEVLAAVNAVTMLVVYGGLGYLGLKIAHSLGFAQIWPDMRIEVRNMLISSTMVGVGVGIALVVTDILFRGFNGFGPAPHPPFPTSLFASISAGIGEEIIFRALLIPVLLWLFMRLPFMDGFEKTAFWIAATISAAIFSAGHFPALMAVVGAEDLSFVTWQLAAQVFLMNGFLALVAAAQFRKNGFLAAVSVHFWADIVWHVIWGAVGV